MVICNHCHKSFRKGNGRGSLKTHCAAIKAARNRKPGKTPKQKLLEPKDIRKLCHIIASLFKHRRKLVKEYPLAKLITRPRVPNTLSEPIVIHLLNQQLMDRGLLHGLSRTHTTVSIVQQKFF